MLKSLLLLAGVGQLILAVGSLAIPRVLRWSDDLAKVRPLTRQVFWTYAGYIWATNVAFGLLSVSMPAALCGGGALAAAVTGFITLYWLARVVIQFVYFDRSSAPPGVRFKVAEVILVGLFVVLTAVYGWACTVNLGVAVP
ncbi:MAG: hypothetical protein ACJ8F7_18920 [Gemmataceae bacterium]